MERIQILETIEKDIIVCLQSAGDQQTCLTYKYTIWNVILSNYRIIWSFYIGQAFVELSKEKSSLKQAEAQTQQFLKTLGHVESKLSEQINYLTQVSTGT